MSSNPTHPLAELRGASKAFGEVQALTELDFAIAPGEVVAVLGPNGAGKTTTVKLLLGLLRPDAGSARVFGAEPTSRSVRVRVGTMLQVGEVPQFLKVREHIELFRSYYPDPMPLDRILAAAGLKEVADRLSRDLSGGQRQRLMFALAICGDPELLFLDEPTVGLDVAARRSFWATIREFVARGRSILLTTHYLEEADALADRIVLLDHGRQVADGTPRAIKSRFSRRRIRCRTRLSDARLEALPGARAVTRHDDRTVTLVSETPESTLRVLLHEDPSLSELEVAGVGLEEAFLSLTGSHTMEDAA